MSVSEHWRRFVKWQDRNPRSTALTAGILIGGIGTIIAERAGKSSGEPATSTGVPPSGPPASASVPPTPSGATLTVRPPKKYQSGTLRAAPGLASAVVAYVPSGTVVQVLSSSMSGDKPSKLWYQVKPPTGPDGWMHGDILA